MKKAVFIFILILLLVPIVEMYLGGFEGRKLKGSFLSTEKNDFTLKGWLNGDYQKNQEAWQSENFGFRNSFIRCYNETQFRLFKKSTNAEARFGKNNIMFAEAYINTYLAKDRGSASEQTIKSRIEKFKFIQDTLQKLNKFAYFIIAPNKARIFNEYLPDQFANSSSDTTIYDLTLKYLRLYNVKYIDFNNYFLYLKSKLPYQVLFPKYGIHWSQASCLFVADSIKRFMENTQSVSLPQFKIEEKIIGDSISEFDYDVADAMNLFTKQLPSPPMIYFRTSVSPGKNKMKGLVFGDSFYFNFLENGFHYNLLAGSKFLYYFNTIYGNTNTDDFYELNFKEELSKNDFVLFMSTEFNLYKAGFGGIEHLYNLLKTGEDKAYSRKTTIKLMESKIRKSPDWFATMPAKATERGISLDSMVTLDAVYILQQEGKIQ